MWGTVISVLCFPTTDRVLCHPRAARRFGSVKTRTEQGPPWYHGGLSGRPLLPNLGGALKLESRISLSGSAGAGTLGSHLQIYFGGGGGRLLWTGLFIHSTHTTSSVGHKKSQTGRSRAHRTAEDGCSWASARVQNSTMHVECTEVGCLAVDDGGHAALKKEVCLRRRHMLLVIS